MAEKQEGRSTATHAPPDPQAGLLAAIEGLLDKRLGGLEERLTKLEGARPRFQPMVRPQRPREGGYVPPEQLRARGMRTLDAAGREVGGGSSLYDDPQRRPRGFRAAFNVGDVVRINPDALIHGGDGKTWQTVMDRPELAECEFVGEVRSLTGFSRTDEPKYRVVIPGLTPVPRGDGFYESELLPV